MSKYEPGNPPPESGMGGASDAGAHGKHPASAAKLGPTSVRPEDAAGDAVVERRRARDSNYTGPERRLARMGGSGASD